MERFSFFWRSESPFSQWHPCSFGIDGQRYNCAEQYMMVQKAIVFEDWEITSQIRKASSPFEQKKLGRKVKGFDRNMWESVCKKIVYEANYTKFTQNLSLKEALLATAGTTVVEASPDDKIWGIGLAEDYPDARNRSTWRGTNWLVKF